MLFLQEATTSVLRHNTICVVAVTEIRLFPWSQLQLWKEWGTQVLQLNCREGDWELKLLGLSLVFGPLSQFLSHWSWKWTLRFVKNVKASSSIIPPDSTFGKSPKLWPSAKVQLHIPATLNVLCKSCTCAWGKVQLYGNTCSVIVSSQGTHRKQMKRASAKLSHLLQPTQLRVFTFLLFSTYVEAVFSKELLLMTELFRFHTTKTHKKWGEKHWIISS